VDLGHNVRLDLDCPAQNEPNKYIDNIVSNPETLFDVKPDNLQQIDEKKPNNIIPPQPQINQRLVNQQPLTFLNVNYNNVKPEVKTNSPQPVFRAPVEDHKNPILPDNKIPIHKSSSPMQISNSPVVQPLLLNKKANNVTATTVPRSMVVYQPTASLTTTHLPVGATIVTGIPVMLATESTGTTPTLLTTG